MYVLLRVRLLLWIIHHLNDIKRFSNTFYEMHVRSPSFLEAKVAHCFLSNEIQKCLLQQREGGFKIHAVSSKDNVRLLRNCARRRLTPIVDGLDDSGRKAIEGDVLLHQSEHAELVGDDKGRAKVCVAPKCYCEAGDFLASPNLERASTLTRQGLHRPQVQL
jgi:hypothetical protein